MAMGIELILMSCIIELTPARESVSEIMLSLPFTCRMSAEYWEM